MKIESGWGLVQSWICLTVADALVALITGHWTDALHASWWQAATLFYVWWCQERPATRERCGTWQP